MLQSRAPSSANVGLLIADWLRGLLWAVAGGGVDPGSRVTHLSLLVISRQINMMKVKQLGGSFLVI